jgi:hypothetical protein
MKLFTVAIINLIGFPLLFFGFISFIPFCFSVKNIVTGRITNEQNKKMVVEASLVSIGTILLLIIIHWKLTELLPKDLRQFLLPGNQYFIAIIGNMTLDIHSILFYSAVIGFVYKLKEVQYGIISKNFFFRKKFLPVIAVSMLCTFLPNLIDLLMKA